MSRLFRSVLDGNVELPVNVLEIGLGFPEPSRTGAWERLWGDP